GEYRSRGRGVARRDPVPRGTGIGCAGGGHLPLGVREQTLPGIFAGLLRLKPRETAARHHPGKRDSIERRGRIAVERKGGRVVRQGERRVRAAVLRRAGVEQIGERRFPLLRLLDESVVSGWDAPDARLVRVDTE